MMFYGGAYEEVCVRGYHIYKEIWNALMGEDIFTLP